MTTQRTDEPPRGQPAAEVSVDEALVRALLTEQHPDLAHLPLAPLGEGWDNVLYRLGDALLVRLPRRQVAAGLVQNEQTWLPRLAPRLPLPIPTPVHAGRPGAGYPWHWSVVPFFKGRCADLEPPASKQAERFADFLLALHTPAPIDAPVNPVRGIPLSARAESTAERMATLKAETSLITAVIEGLWSAGLAAAEARERHWLHGDLHAQNVLVDASGVITAIVDWGDITGGDVATDLAGIWALFAHRRDRHRVFERYGPDQPTLDRARGWAVLFGVVLTDSGRINNPRHARLGARILSRLMEDAA